MAGRRILAVVFRERAGKKEFLVLHRFLNWAGWEMLKGHIDKTDSPYQALKKELFEEAGIKKIISSKLLKGKFFFESSVSKNKTTVIPFIVKVSAGTRVSLSNNIVKEHSSFRWVESKTALELLTFRNQRKIFKLALKKIVA